MRPLLKNILLLISVVLILLIIAETYSRYTIYKKTPPDYLFDDNIIYTVKPHGEIFKVPVNNIGCVGTDITQFKRNNEKRIFLLGGSTSYSSDYVNQVRQQVSMNNPEYDITVVSCGKPRYTSYINLVNLKRYLLSYSPDIIVLYLGINDSIYNTFYWLDKLPDIGYFNWRSFRESMLLKLFKYHIIDILIRSRPDFLNSPLRSVPIFKENISSIIETAHAHNVKVVLSTFALSYPTEDNDLRKRIKSDEGRTKHFWGTIDSTVYAVKKHNEVMDVLAQQYKLPLARVDKALPANSKYFTDICHMTKEGKVVLGNTIAGAIGRIDDLQ
jgi:lysophospholipase L1-like esterase